MACAANKGANITISGMKTSYKYLGLYIGLTFLLAILSLASNISFTTFALTVARKIHNNMLNSVLRTKLSFFDTTPQGRIMNRMSKDTDSVDTNILRFA